MSTRPSTGRRPCRKFEETMVFEMRPEVSSGTRRWARRVKDAKASATRRDRRAARSSGYATD